MEQVTRKHLRAISTPDGFAVLSRGTSAIVGMPSLLAEVGEQVGQIFAAEFKRPGYDPKAAPIYAQASPRPRSKHEGLRTTIRSNTDRVRIVGRDQVGFCGFH